jgi:hypothetical protein
MRFIAHAVFVIAGAVAAIGDLVAFIIVQVVYLASSTCAADPAGPCVTLGPMIAVLAMSAVLILMAVACGITMAIVWYKATHPSGSSTTGSSASSGASSSASSGMFGGAGATLRKRLSGANGK